MLPGDRVEDEVPREGGEGAHPEEAVHQGPQTHDETCAFADEEEGGQEQGVLEQEEGGGKAWERDALRVDVHVGNRPEGARDGIREHPESREHPRGGKAVGGALEGHGDPGDDEELRPGERGAEPFVIGPIQEGCTRVIVNWKPISRAESRNALSNTGSSSSARSKRLGWWWCVVRSAGVGHASWRYPPRHHQTFLPRALTPTVRCQCAGQYP